MEYLTAENFLKALAVVAAVANVARIFFREGKPALVLDKVLALTVDAHKLVAPNGATSSAQLPAAGGESPHYEVPPKKEG